MSATQWTVLEYATKSKTDRLHVIIQSDTENIARCTGFNARENASHIVSLHNASIELSARINDQTKVTSNLLENTDKIRAELARLRAAADELQRIRELIEPLKGQSVYDAIDALLSDASSAEIYKIDMAEQARQLDAAREIISVAKNDYQEDVQDGIDSYDKGQRCIDWLAANPAPEPQP